MNKQVTPPHGRIEMIAGCMFSGKTADLINRAEKAQLAGDTVLAFKAKLDDRYDEQAIVSHEDRSFDAVPISADGSGMDLLRERVADEQPDVVIIDEANFFTEDLVRTVRELADDGYRVVLSGLDQTFRGDPFGPVPQLLSIADHVEKHHAVCEVCGNVATKTQRLIDGEPAPYDAPTIDVGAEEKYEARCRACHRVPRNGRSQE